MSKIFQKLQKISQKTLLIIIGVLLVLVLLSGTLVYSYFNSNNFNSKNSQNNSTSSISLNSSELNTPNLVSNPQISQNNSQNSSQVSQNFKNQISKTANNSANNPNVEKVQLETTILEECDLVINYNPAKYYVLESENIYSVGTKLEIREKNLATSNESLLLYQCNLDNYRFGDVSNQLQQLYPSSNFKIPLFDNVFWDKTIEAGVIEFPGNVARRTKEEFPLDFFQVKDNPNFQTGIKTKDLRTIFHQMTFRKDPISWNGQDLQFSLKNPQNKQTKPILSNLEYKKLANEEKISDAKSIKKFQNFDKIKFDGKINKISDIPKDLLDKYGIPQFGFRFFKGVVFWTGYRNNSQEFEDSLTNFEKNNVENKTHEVSNEGIIAYDGTNVVELKDENDKEIQNYYGHSIGVYYLSTLIKDGIGYNFGQSCGHSECNIAPGFFIDFNKGEYWINKEPIDSENNTLENIKNIEPYLDFDFKVWSGMSPRIIGIIGGTGYKTHKDGKIYGKFQKYTSQIKDGFPISDGEFLVESDGQNYKFIAKTPKSACANPVASCSDKIAFNNRGNVVYYGDILEVQIQNQTENSNHQNESKNNQKMKFIEQELATGKILQEEISIKNETVLKKFGLTKIN